MFCIHGVPAHFAGESPAKPGMNVSCPEMGLHISKLKTGQMEKKLFQPHYDRAFKTKVIEEYLATGCTKMYLLRKYNIHFKSAIQTWMRVLGFSEPDEALQKFTFGNLILLPCQRKKILMPRMEQIFKTKSMNWNASSKKKSFVRKRMQE